MRTAVRKFGLSLLLAGLLAGPRQFPAVLAQEAPDERAAESSLAADLPADVAGPATAPPGIVFFEIRLSEDRAVATDTSGREWVYDFNADVWVEGTPGQEGGRLTDRLQPRTTLPIDLRAICLVAVKPFERSVTIGYDEYVDGDIIATGRVTVKGWVKGDVRSIDKRVLVTETGQVDGSVEAPSVIIRPGGVVSGTVRETGGPLDVESLTRAVSVDALVLATAPACGLLFFGFLVLAVAPRQAGRIDACITGHRVRTCALGFLFSLLLPVIIALFIITLVGILVVPFVPLVYAGAIGMGFVSFGGTIGGWVLRRLTGARQGTQLRTALGTLLLALLWLLVIVLLGGGNAFLLGLGYALLAAAIPVTSFPVFAGIGGAILTRFGFRDYVSWKERKPADTGPPAPAPPPLHEPPPIITPWPPAPEPPERREPPQE